MIGVRIGPFEVKQLGEGGMGRAFLAEHTVLNTARVTKVLLPELTRNASVVQRFINEARAAVSAQHHGDPKRWVGGQTIHQVARKKQSLADFRQPLDGAAIGALQMGNYLAPPHSSSSPANRNTEVTSTTFVRAHRARTEGR
jgi:serine/threonine protein kinase